MIEKGTTRLGRATASDPGGAVQWSEVSKATALLRGSLSAPGHEIPKLCSLLYHRSERMKMSQDWKRNKNYSKYSISHPPHHPQS